PHAFQESRRWCFLTLKPGTEPLKALVESFLDTWQLGATDPERVKQQNGWIELMRDGKVMLGDLLDATERRYKELDRTKLPAFLLYVDQGEELYVRAEERQRRRFSEVIAQGAADPRLYMLMSMRTDFLGKLANLREGEEPTRRRALRSEFSDEEWRLVSELANHPYRLLVTATPEGSEPYAEVAHEAIFRRWDKLGNWIAAEREFLAWRTGLEAARRAWQGRSRRAKKEVLLIGFPLKQASR